MHSDDHLESVEALKLRFESSVEKSIELHERLLSEAVARCLQRIVTRGRSFLFRPFEPEIFGFAAPQVLNKMPAKLSDVYVNYLDTEGKVHLVEQMIDTAKPRNREFFTYGHNLVQSCYFFYAGNPKVRNVSDYIYQDNLLKEVVNYGGSGASIWTYSYKGQLVSSILIRETEHAEPKFSNRLLDFEYIGDALSKITSTFENGYQELIYPK
jgi:hypothetical protein